MEGQLGTVGNPSSPPSALPWEWPLLVMLPGILIHYSTIDLDYLVLPKNPQRYKEKSVRKLICVDLISQTNH